MQTHGGKGSTPRPVNKEKFDVNWDRIFGGENREQKVDSVVEREVQSATASEDRLGQERCDDRV